MINKSVSRVDEAVEGIEDGATILIGGFGDSGVPFELIDALVRSGASDLTVVSNNAGSGDRGVGALLKDGRVRRMICSYPRSRGSVWFERLYAKDEIELELVPQGTLAERIRAGGAGIAGFYTPTGVGTLLAENKETHEFDGRTYVLERALRGDVALIAGHVADRWGNLVYRRTGRNYGPIMATAADLTIAQVHSIVDVGELDPEVVITPGIFVDRIVAV
jgi:3-oxoadipate CoA-transferase alpha subunit